LRIALSDLGSADLEWVALESADLGAVDLDFADLDFADLGSADLDFADRGSANLGSADPWADDGLAFRTVQSYLIPTRQDNSILR
jgi:uncharacterized protein YjbI with pentapeptide repeats